MKKFIILFLFPILIYSNDYYIEDLGNSFDISKEIVVSLKNNGVKTTKIFLEKNKNKKFRALNAKKYKIELKKINYLYSTFSLMQIKGVGPKVSKLLYKTGVKSLKQLKKSNLKELEKKLIKINKKYKILSFTPNIENLTYWIKQIDSINKSKL